MKIHIVQKGDTIWGIAEQYGVDFEDLMQLNSHLSSPDMIMPGMKIKIPSTSKHVKTDEKKKQTVTKEKEKKQDVMPLKPLQQPQLSEESLGVEQKLTISKPKKKQLTTDQPVQQNELQLNKQPIKQFVPQKQHVDEPTHIKKQKVEHYDQQQLAQHMQIKPKQHEMMYGPQYAINPVHSHFHPPCCCHCYHFMQQHYVPHKQMMPHMRQAHQSQTYVFNE